MPLPSIRGGGVGRGGEDSGRGPSKSDWEA